MASLLKSLALFKKNKDKPPLAAGSGGAIRGIKHVIVVPIPGDSSITTRSRLLDRLVKMVGDPDISGPKLTGALISILSLFVESPGQLIQRITDDPDISIKLVEVIQSDKTQSGLTFASRGTNMDDEADRYFTYDEPNDGEERQSYWFENREIQDIEVQDPEGFNMILATILAQIWILLAKAVTAPDTAADSELRRWVKYTQQRRVIGEFRLDKGWLDIVRNRIAEDLSLRRFMVALILDIKRTPGNKPRIAEMICDIDTYIVEAGLASFILTIKFGIETMYPALGLHEFAGELSTIESLMNLYQQMGELAPYMVILENSIQNKFSAGAYPLLWSYAMGVGVELENSMGGLNFGRSYFDPAYFRLGQEMVRRSAGKVSSNLASELGITEEEARLVSEIAAYTGDDRNNRTSGPKQAQVSFLRTDQGNETQHNASKKDEARAPQVRKENRTSSKSDGYRGDTDREPASPSVKTLIDVETTPETDTDPLGSKKSAEALIRLQAMASILEDSILGNDSPRAYNDKDLLS
uniref:Nucleocapsid n=1 Tax=Rinderpest morbillivirus TaxID=11241 RepID=A2IB90_9MONO|nr:nucleoprotein [Rinderpest morbillivirus]QJD08158.1 nucleocapsid protein [Rinderpest morbillivirus]QJD08361.1 nucleocapsid protein [Rinderpest morbillivirus]QJD08984.1 nucleocapsid protein [Rinderpest morbillivirus]